MNVKIKKFTITLFKWIFLGGVIGLVVGSMTSFLLKMNDFLGNEIRMNNFWLIFFLLFAGIAVGYLYMNFGKEGSNDSAKGNNLVIDGVHGKARVLRRMGPIIFLGTFITVLFGGATRKRRGSRSNGRKCCSSPQPVF